MGGEKRSGMRRRGEPQGGEEEVGIASDSGT